MTLFATLLLATGCTSIFAPVMKPVSPPTLPESSLAYAYVSTNSNQVYTFTISSAGLWSPLPNGAVATGLNPTALAVDPSSRFLYTVNTNDIDLSQYEIDPVSGIPSPDIPSTLSIPGNVRPDYLEIDPSGRFLYVPVNFQIRMYLINPASGVLTPNNPATIAAKDSTGASANSAIIVPSGKYLYANTGHSLLEYRLDTTSGLLTQIGSIRSGGGRGFAPVVDPGDRFVYIVDEVNDLLHIFAVDQVSGLLSPGSPATVPVGSGPSSLALDPMGRYLYVVNRSEGTISQFAVHQDGSVTPMTPATIQQSGFKMIVDPSAQLAYVDGAFQGKPGVSIYRVNASGGLEPYSSVILPQGSIDIAVARHH